MRNSTTNPGTQASKMSFHNLSISVLKVGRQLAGFLVVAAFFSACFKEETPVPAHSPGSVTTAKVNLGSDYRYQVFFSLSKDSAVSQNLKTDWDISFDAQPGAQTVYLNSAKFMFAARGLTEANGAGDTTGFYLKKRWDAANTPDSLAIGNKYDANVNFVIDLGLNELGLSAGLKTLRILSADDQKYQIEYANIDGSQKQTASVLRDTNYARMYFSFKTNQTVSIEPPKRAWDLVFTQYLHTFYEPYTPYLVTGVIINPYNTTTAADSSGIFPQINQSFANKLDFTPAPEGIGFSWKSFSDSNYKLKPNITYLVKTSASEYYKLHFIDFYNDKGVKGNPTFEYQRL